MAIAIISGIFTILGSVTTILLTEYVRRSALSSPPRYVAVTALPAPPAPSTPAAGLTAEPAGVLLNDPASAPAPPQPASTAEPPATTLDKPGLAPPKPSPQVLERVPFTDAQPTTPEVEERLKEMAGSVVYGDFWRRAGAYLIDYTLYFLALFAVIIPLSFAGDNVTTAATIFASFVFATYFTVSWSVWGQTYGQKLFGLRVLRQNFHSLTVMRSFARLLALNLALTTVVGVLMVAFTKKNRGLADYVTDTVVVRDAS